MRKKEISSLDHYATNGQEKARMTENNGQKGYSKKSGKASSRPRRRQGNERASDGKKQREGTRQSIFKLADLLPDETINKLWAIKEAKKENGRTNPKRSTSRK